MKSKKLGTLREELNQFLGRYLIEGLHLSHLSLRRCLVVKALPCQGAKVHKLKAAFISKNLRFYGIKALN